MSAVRSRATTAAALLAAASLCLPAGAAAAAPAPARAATAPSEVAAAVPSGWASTSADLVEVRAQRVLFGHQSVGWNLMEGMGALYTARGRTPIAVRAWSTSLRARGAWWAEAGIGSNGDPVSKIRAFSALVRGGAGARVTVAMMKLCFVDITAGTNVPAVFKAYRTTLAALAKAYPKVTFVHLTVPLTTRGDAADNVARQKYNALMRAAYGPSGRLFDLAAVESTSPTGARVTGVWHGARWYAMHPAYTSDGGHLNAVGSRRAADRWVHSIALAHR